MFVKVVYNGEVRRLEVDASSDASFQHLLQQTKELFSVPTRAKVSMKYEDDEKDMCTVSSTPELAEAQRIATKEHRPILKLFLFCEDATVACTSPSSARNCRSPDVVASCEAMDCASPLSPTLSHEQTSSLVSAPPPSVLSEFARNNCDPNLKLCLPPLYRETKDGCVHHGFTCEQCGLAPIVGDRFHCDRCSTDVCADCEAKGCHDGDHVLLKFKVPVAVTGGSIPFQLHARDRSSISSSDRACCVGHENPVHSISSSDRACCVGHENPVQSPEAAVDCPIDGSAASGTTWCLPNAHITKGWRVRNSGLQPWPACFLVHESGSVTPVQAQFPVPSLLPGHAADVTVAVMTPAKLGKHVSSFRLSSTFGTFGPRLWLDLTCSNGKTSTGEDFQPQQPLPRQCHPSHGGQELQTQLEAPAPAQAQAQAQALAIGPTGSDSPLRLFQLAAMAPQLQQQQQIETNFGFQFDDVRPCKFCFSFGTLLFCC